MLRHMRALFIFLFILPLCAQVPEGWQAPGPNTRLMRHQDGSQTVYKRSTGQKNLVKKKIGADGQIKLSTHYFMDDRGNPRACKIYNSKNSLLYKVSYAYQRSTGKLVAENMYDAQRKNPKTGKNILVSQTRYTYDAHGNRSRPLTYTFVDGKSAEDYFGKKGTTMPEKVFGNK